MKREEWEDIPGLDGYFLISNFGRVKRLQYEMLYRNGAIYVKPEKIIKPAVLKIPNRYKKDYVYFLANRITLQGVRNNISVARLVYYCFVKTFDIGDQQKVILCRDGDNLNIRPSNLFLATLHDKAKRIFVRKRALSPLLKLSEASKQRRQANIIKKKSKKVTQYSSQGKKLKTF